MKRTPLTLLTHLPAASLLAAALPALTANAQKLTVVLDAARGGSEYGARIDGHTYEKQVTLDVSERLRSLLAARDFNVVLTRESDVQIPNEQRAAVANQNKPIACILLHATASGTGLHLWTSSLSPAAPNTAAVLWDEAQSTFVQRSQRLATELAAALGRSKFAVSSGHTWIRPLDNMQCPAVAIEIAPEDSDTPASDHSYQNHIADAVAAQLLFWRGHADIVDSVLNPPPPAPAPAKPGARPAEAAAANAAKTGSGTGDAAPSAAHPAASSSPRAGTSAAASSPKPASAAAVPRSASKPKPAQPAAPVQEPPQ